MFCFLLTLAILLASFIVFKYWIKFRLLLFGKRIRVLINSKNKEQSNTTQVSSPQRQEGSKENRTKNGFVKKIKQLYYKRKNGHFVYTLYYTGIKRNIYIEKKHGYFIWLPRNTDASINLFNKAEKRLATETINPNEECECFLKINNKKAKE